MTREALLQDIEGFLDRVGMTATKFGKLSVNDPTLVHRMRKGADVRMETAEKLRKFMAEHQSPRPLDRRNTDRPRAA
jgi:hypothetical protein